MATAKRQRVKLRKVTFSLEVPGAQQVVLLGKFNNWDPGAHLMKHRKAGIWHRTVFLPQGTHTYQYLIGGERKADAPGDQTRFDSLELFRSKPNGQITGRVLLIDDAPEFRKLFKHKLS